MSQPSARDIREAKELVKRIFEPGQELAKTITVDTELLIRVLAVKNMHIRMQTQAHEEFVDVRNNII